MGNCNTCGSENTFGMSRVVGYYSIIENWNSSKQAEFKDRQKGFYKFDEMPIKEQIEQECIIIQ